LPEKIAKVLKILELVFQPNDLTLQVEDHAKFIFETATT
jgi:hypothetical protein